MLVVGALIAWTYIRQPVRQHVVFTGSTMGTTYEVKIPHANLTTRGIHNTQRAFDEILDRVNSQMSTYLPDSEINQFNQNTSTAPFEVSHEFANVVREALQLAEATEGAFDPTVLPLVHAWGFGNTTNAPRPPPTETLETISAQVGYQKLSVPAPSRIQKSAPALQLDLGAIAKGYAVDQIAAQLEKRIAHQLLHQYRRRDSHLRQLNKRCHVAHCDRDPGAVASATAVRDR